MDFYCDALMYFHSGVDTLNVENVEELFSVASASGDEELANAIPLAIAATLDYARETANTTEE